MATQQLTRAPQKFSVAIQGEGYKRLIANTLTDPKRAARFVANVSAAVAVNPALQNCDAGTILSAALVGESLNLSPSPQLGQFYMVPFNDFKRKRMVATFILGYKGYIQLALRSGQYRKLNVLALKHGELKRYDPLNEEIEVKLIEDDAKRELAPTTHYFGMFEYLNGFRKTILWSKEKMLCHADRFSKAFKREEYEKLLADGKIPTDEYDKAHSSFWYRDFDGMGLKTILRQLISKWGIMSLELQTAFERDESFADTPTGPATFITENDIKGIKAETVAAVEEAASAASSAASGADAPPKPAERASGASEPEDAELADAEAQDLF